MFPKILTQIFGSRNDRLLKGYRRTVQQINALEPQFEALDDAQLRAKTDEFRARIANGETLDQFFAGSGKLDRAAIGRQVRDAGYDIVKGKGYTSYGVATAVVRICEAIIRDERAVVPVSTLLTGQYGLSDLCLSLPCVLGAGGVERVLTPYLDPDEATALAASGRVLTAAFAALSGAAPGR